MDLSIVGRDDCGHMRVDVELCSSFKLCWTSARTFCGVTSNDRAMAHVRTLQRRANTAAIGKVRLFGAAIFDVLIPEEYQHQEKIALLEPLNVLDLYLFDNSNKTMCECEIKTKSLSMSLDLRPTSRPILN